MNRTRNRAAARPNRRRPSLFPFPSPATGCRLALAAGAALLLAGCAGEPIVAEPQRNEAVIHVRLVDHIDYEPGAHAYGLSRCANGVCTVQILRKFYPYCLTHEIRHVFEGDWHHGRETLDGC